jgi:Fe-S-cluster containining protein
MTEIQKLYLKITKSSCKNGCFECCTNIVQFAKEEAERVGEYKYDGACAFLIEMNGNKKCGVYENRPMVCRIYGASEIMKCEGCEPERFLNEAETRAIIKEYAKIKDAQDRLI